VIDRYHGFQLIEYSESSALGEFLKEIIIGASPPVAVLPSPKGLWQPRGDSAEPARLPPSNWRWMELHPQLHKATKHAVLISYSKDDLLDKECAIPCKWGCHGSANFLLRWSAWV